MKFTPSLLPALAVFCLAGCNNAPANKPKAAPSGEEKERVIIISPVRDSTSVHNHVRSASFPFQYDMGDMRVRFPDSVRKLFTGEFIMEVQSDTTKLHIKGDSCWIEYISAGILHSKMKDGSYSHDPTAISEPTDTMRIR